MASALTTLQFRQKRIILNIAPVIAAGIGEQQMDVDVTSQRLQRLQIDRRQRRDATDKDPFGQIFRRAFRLIQRLDKSRIEVGAVPFRLAQGLGITHQIAPQCGLPALRLAQPLNGFAALPAVEPVGTIDQILVEQIGHAGAELKQFTLIAIVMKIVA